MPKEQVHISTLQDYLPAGAYAPVLHYIQQYRVQLTVTRERKTLLGDYRHRTAQQRHRISVNGNLNKYAFLITLLHEFAHLFTYEQFGNRVSAHGKEWKRHFSVILQEFMNYAVFPSDIQQALQQSIRNPAASSCADEQLMRVLSNYDTRPENTLRIEELANNNIFQTPDGRIFQRGEKLRKRFKCTEIATGRQYLFSPVYVVQLLTLA